MRILVHGFNESERVTQRAITVVANAPNFELVGWVARPRFRAVFCSDGPPCPRFEEPFPACWTAPLDADPRLGVSSPLVDENLRYLLDREKHFNDEYEVTRWRAEIICRAQQVLNLTDPDVLIFSDVPHSALSYALYVVAHERGLTTLYFRYGPAPHLFTFCDRIGRPLHEFVTAGVNGRTSDPSIASVEFIERLSRNYRAAAPTYMRKQIARSTLPSRVWHTIRDRPRAFLSADAIAKARTNLRRQRLRASYERRAVGPDALTDQFIALFLHLQPERSTTPEGGFFAQQWLIAHSLARQLPVGWALVAREHPSTFVTGPRVVRNPEFYDAFLAIPGLRLASMTVDPFDLIDRSRAVATVTGSVGLEAVVRGRPALLFGDSAYRGCPGTFHVGGPDGVAAALAEAEHSPALDRTGVLQFLAEFESSPWVAMLNAHGDDIGTAVASGQAHAHVLQRMLTYLSSDRSS